MKKIICLMTFLVLMVLCSCSSNGTSKTSGVIDCYSIKVTEGGSSVFSQTYFATTSKVFEYKSAKGDFIYANYRYQYNDSSYQLIDGIINVYPDRYTSEYIEYTFVKFVGWLTVEYNYYFDIDNRTIDSEVKYSEYLYANNPTTDAANNKVAYECAKKNYYLLTSSAGFNKAYNLKMDLEEKSLERHTYTKLGDDSIITYKAKWF